MQQYYRQPKTTANYLKHKPTDSRRYVAFYPGLTFRIQTAP